MELEYEQFLRIEGALRTPMPKDEAGKVRLQRSIYRLCDSLNLNVKETETITQMKTKLRKLV